MSLINLIRQGDVIGAVKKVIALAEGLITSIETDFPFLGSFISQFETDLGKAILAKVETAAPAVIANPSTFVSTAESIARDVVATGISVGEQDATQVALNALRAAVSAPSTPPAASTDPETA